MGRLIGGMVILAIALGGGHGFAAKPTDGGATVSGVILPLDDASLYLRSQDGQVAVRWTKETKVAIKLNSRLIGNTEKKLTFGIHSSTQKMSIPLPATQAWARKTFDVKTLKEVLDENWTSFRGVTIHFGDAPPAKLPTASDPELIGPFTFPANRQPATITIDGRKFEVSMKKGGQTDVPIYGVWAPKDCKPFANEATAIGRMQGETLIADEIHVTPIGDQVALDDPKLPRYLVIGDSISGNYNSGLRAALKGKFNIHHPPTNCGPSGKGVGSIDSWLGAWKVKGRHWDVISFNFGHWDAGNTKEEYQANLAIVIGKLKATGAKLIWVTTGPVPKGYPPAGALIDKSGSKHAPSRTSGVMEKYLNPWALAVVKKHPEIAICDQWQFVKDNNGGLYTEWWKGKNVHFGGKAADALGELLAAKVLEVTRKK